MRRHMRTLGICFVVCSVGFGCARLGVWQGSAGRREAHNLVIVSWGDQIMVATGDAQLDAPEKIRRAIRSWRAGCDARTVLWRASSYYIRRFYERRTTSKSGFIRKYYKKVEDVRSRFDPLKVARQAARDNGQAFLLYMTIYDHGAPSSVLYGGSTPFPWQDRATIAHPEFQAVDRRGNIHHGVLEMAYPEARRLMVERMRAFVEEFEADGVYVCTRTHSLPALHADQFGFSPPVVAEYRRRYGLDILTDPRFDYTSPQFAPQAEAVAKWRRLRGEYLVQFHRELRAALPGRIIYTGIPRGRYAGPPYGNRYLDWESLVRERLIDGLVLGVRSGKGLHPPLYVPHAQIGYLSSEDDRIAIPERPQAVHEVYGPLCKAHGVRLFVQGGYGPKQYRWLRREPLLDGFMVGTPSGGAHGVVEHADAMCFPRGRGTIEAWVCLNPGAKHAWTRILSKYDHGDADKHRGWEWIILPDGRFRFRVNQVESGDGARTKEVALESAKPLPVGRWLHIATVIDLPKRQMRLYLDGRLDSKLSVQPWPIRLNREQALLIGVYGGTSVYRLAGRLDELRLTADALEFDAPPSHPYTGRERGTVLLYHFDHLTPQNRFLNAASPRRHPLLLVGAAGRVLGEAPSPAFGHSLDLSVPRD